MKKQRKSMLILAVMVAFVGLGLFLPGLIGAGDLEPSSPPGSTMHTLDEIYNKLVSGCPECDNAPVAKTGQTTIFATGDDGDYEMGVANPSPRFTDNGDGTVTDNLTGLIWLQYASCFGSRNWATALIDCNLLNSGECGLTDDTVEGDWRFPNVKELQSLIDFGQLTPALPSGHPFTSVQSNTYWSSTTYAGITGYAWSVYMSNGNVLFNINANHYFVWPVRGGN